MRWNDLEAQEMADLVIVVTRPVAGDNTDNLGR